MEIDLLSGTRLRVDERALGWVLRAHANTRFLFRKRV
jgi:hypothetical protein